MDVIDAENEDQNFFLKTRVKDLLHLPSSVGWSVGQLVDWLVGWFPSNTQVVNVSETYRVKLFNILYGMVQTRAF